MTTRTLTAALVATSSLAAAGPAAAVTLGPATFCVHHPANACPAGSVDEGTDLQKALGDAAANSVPADAPNVVKIGPGTFQAAGTSTFEYLSANPLRIVGAGVGATTLTNAAAGSSGVIRL